MSVAVRLAAATVLVAAAAATAAAQHDHAHAGAAAHAAAPASLDPALHMRTTDPRPPAPGDSARLERLTEAVRRGIARYRDVRAAERAGYRPVFVGDTSAGQVLHYSHLWNGLRERRRLDPARPGSLLYEVQPDGARRLVGAMYSAPDDATPAQLDARVPLAYARWHLHTDLCLPKPVWSRAEWARTLPDGRPAFGPESPVATRAACERQGGAFKDHVFGWMVHAMVADNPRPADAWGGDHGHAMRAPAAAPR